MRALTFLLFVLSITLCVAELKDCTPVVSELDKAWIRFIYNKGETLHDDKGPEKLYINMTVSECFNCLDKKLIDITATNPDAEIKHFLFSTRYLGTFFIYRLIETKDPKTGEIVVTKNLLTEQPYSIKEQGRYTFKITDVYDQTTKAWTGISFNAIIDKEGNNIFVPIYIALGSFAVMAILYNAVCYVSTKKDKILSAARKGKSSEMGLLGESQTGERLILNSVLDSNPLNSQNKERTSVVKAQAEAPPKGKNTKERLQSLDTFRGLSLTIMLFVNSGAGAYVDLDHAAWNGLNLADMVFPWFIWMMGVSMAISFASQQKRGASNKEMITKVLIRTAKLAFLGMMTSNGGKPIDMLRWCSVLIRFAISYLAIALIIIYIPKKKKQSEEGEGKYEDLVPFVYEFIVIGAILALWLGITFGMSVPGCPTGYIGAGGLYGDFGKYQNCTGGAAGYLDKIIFGLGRLYQAPTPMDVYGTQAFDPEGALGCLTSIVMVYFGLMAGRVILHYKTHKERITRWLVAGVILGVISLILTKGTKNNGWIPINKNLWSLSFITTQACLGLFALASLYVLIDILKIWGGGPFKAMGMNSIAIFCGSSFIARFFPFSIQAPLANGCDNPINYTHGWILFRDLKNTCIWLILANWMHYEKFYLNV